MVEKAKDAGRVAEDLMASKLDGYLPEVAARPARTPVKARTMEAAPVTRARLATSAPSAAPPKDRAWWAKQVPGLETPHVLSEVKADAVLRGVRASVEVRGGRAVFGPEAWDTLVSEVVGMMFDCAEGAGLVVKNRAVAGMARRMVERMLRDDMQFWADDDSYVPVMVRD